MSDHAVPAKECYLPFVPAPAPGVRTLAEIQTDLKRPVHPDFLEDLTKKGTEITFIAWHTAARILDKYAAGWSYHTHSHLSADGQRVVIDVVIGIPTSDRGLVERGGTGWDKDDPKAYGDASDRAESQALRRAAAKFGLCLYLYYEKGADGPTQRNPPALITAPAPGSTADEVEAARAAVPPAPPPPGDSAAAFDAIGHAAAAPAEPVITEIQIRQIRGLLASAGMTEPDLTASLQIEALGLLPAAKATKVLTRLRQKAQERTVARAPQPIRAL